MGGSMNLHGCSSHLSLLWSPDGLMTNKSFCHQINNSHNLHLPQQSLPHRSWALLSEEWTRHGILVTRNIKYLHNLSDDWATLELFSHIQDIDWIFNPFLLDTLDKSLFFYAYLDNLEKKAKIRPNSTPSIKCHYWSLKGAVSPAIDFKWVFWWPRDPLKFQLSANLRVLSKGWK